MSEILGKKNKINILKVAFSNVVKLLSGVLVGLLLPKIIGVTDYGYYKTFTLYGVYVGLFTFGITDGIYLKFGGKDYSELDKASFRFYTRIFFLLQLVFSAVTAAVSCLCLPGEYRFIFLCLALYLLFFNIISYFQIISQITGRFTELSIRNLIQSVLQSVAILFMYFFTDEAGAARSYRFFTVIYVSITVALAIWYIFTYRDIVFGKSKTLKDSKSDIKAFVTSGIPLLVSNLGMLLLLSLDRQFVNVLYDTDTYSVYAFAYNMLSLFTTTLSAISIVIYPSLKRTEEADLKGSYQGLVFSVLSLAYAGIAVYFPLRAFVPWFLPKYESSLPIFRIIMPGLAISSAVTIVMHNYYKVLNLNFRFFINCVIILAASVLGNLTAYFIWGTPESISIASIIVLALWYLMCDHVLAKRYHADRIPRMLYILLMSCGFYAITMVEQWWLGLIIYSALYLSVRLIFRKAVRTK
ncbi:MAG: hypothetical protein K6G24_06700 [Lachnospiraceae bacterium]|nr:hypothetical protein [Lachnospiraceae bacterium]